MTSTANSTASPVRLADDDAEWVDVVDHSNNVISSARRADAHRDGLIHRAAHVMLFRRGPPLPAQLGPTSLEVLMQLRSKAKRICPECWDLSVAEHVQRGESHEAAAARGLVEELGLQEKKKWIGERLELVRGPYLREAKYITTKTRSDKVLDNEIVEVFAAEYLGEEVDGKIVFDEVEVQGVQWVRIDEAFKMMCDSPETMTDWFVDDISNIDFNAIARRVCGQPASVSR
jgi:isopentenyldiphosphate isomerase